MAEVKVELDDQLIEKIDQLKTAKNYPPRSHIIKYIIEDWFKIVDWAESKEALNAKKDPPA